MSWKVNEVRKVKLTFLNPRADRNPVVIFDVYEDQRVRFSTVLIEYLKFVEAQGGLVKKVDTVLDAESGEVCSLQIETVSINQDAMIQEFMNRTAEFRVVRTPPKAEK
jgi:hypothetical protein